MRLLLLPSPLSVKHGSSSSSTKLGRQQLDIWRDAAGNRLSDGGKIRSSERKNSGRLDLWPCDYTVAGYES